MFFDPDKPRSRRPAPTYWTRDSLSWSVPFIRIAGVSVRLHVLFLLFIAYTLLGPLLASKQGVSFNYLLMSVGCLWLSVLLHEFGHVTACRLVGGEADEILLWPLGGLAMCRPPHTWQASLITTLGGPLVNVLLMLPTGLAILAAGGGREAVLFNPFTPIRAMSDFQSAIGGSSVASSDLATTLWTIVWWMYYANLGLLLFNMLLVMFPMDAGRVLQEILWSRVGYRRSMKIAATVGIVVASLVGMYGLVRSESTLLLIAVFSGFTCFHELQRVQFAERAGVESEEEESPFAASLRPDRESEDTDAMLERKRKEAQRRQEEEQRHQQELDRILAKISTQGMGALTRSEKRFLEQDTTRRRQAR
ncbi:MAG: hypothetical protein IBJ18_00210 [Phycisphaerales bacterium]|nr:hypothetical protein [Phycisphaerales bacterium]